MVDLTQLLYCRLVHKGLLLKEIVPLLFVDCPLARKELDPSGYYSISVGAHTRVSLRYQQG